jgi:nitrogen fixation/metabolism regulation signal transduction histidine kinase
MKVKNFRLNVLIRVIFISLTLTIFFYMIFYTPKIATIIVIGLLFVYQVYLLISYVERTNRDLARFLGAIEYSDFSQSFINTSLGKSFGELNRSFNRIIEKFQRSRSEKEEQLRYLETVMQHVGVGLIAYDQNGNVEFMNNAAKKLLNIPGVPNVTALNKLGGSFVETLFDIRAGEKKTIKLVEQDDIIQLIIYATEFKLRDKKITLVSLQNIQIELEEKETEAWQQLIRVLTHEIMNSITPISSLASTVSLMLPSGNMETAPLDEETMKDVNDAVNTIKRRSEGLIHFVNSYRNLTKIPKPNFQIFQLSQLFGRVRKLMQSEMMENGINFITSVRPETLELTADPELIEQVIINLVINSEQALKEMPDPEVSLASYLDEKGKVVIKVTDNGPGIPEDIAEKIFVPFFTTKKNGSGIGLSLAKQIVRLHRGSIRVSSKPGEGTSFTLKF